MRSYTQLGLTAILLPVLLIGCGGVDVTGPSDPQGAPPLDASEGVVAVQTSRGRAAAELLAGPAEIAPGGQVIVRVANRGDLQLAYGRPIRVERWDGSAWIETEDSRQAAWTMELILLGPQQVGVEQRWPFSSGQTPRSGWYRFTKHVHVEGTTNEAERFTVMARVRVTP